MKNPSSSTPEYNIFTRKEKEHLARLYPFTEYIIATGFDQRAPAGASNAMETMLQVAREEYRDNDGTFKTKSVKESIIKNGQMNSLS